MQKIIIIGASGFGKEAAWVIGRIGTAFEIVGFCDDAVDKQSGVFAGYPLLGSLGRLGGDTVAHLHNFRTLELPNVRTSLLGFFCAIGNNCNRQRVTAEAVGMGLTPVTVIDPTAIIAPDAVIGAGTFIGIGSIVSAGAKVGGGVIVNHQACVGHDTTLGDFAQVCPGVHISGGCDIGEGALLGTHAATLPLKKVGAWSTLGAGTTALRDIPEGATIIRLKG